MRKVAIIAIMAGLLLAGLSAVPNAFANGDHGKGGEVKFTKHFNKTMFKIGEAGLISMEILPDDSEYGIGKDVVGIVLHDARDGDITGGKISISYKNRDTGEAVSSKISIKEKGGGLYIVSGLDLTLDGNFELTINASKGKRKDSATFMLPEAWKDMKPKGKY